MNEEQKVPFDDLLDIAYAEIYCAVRELERDGKCDADLDTDSLCYECKKLASEFVETYRKLNEYSEPDFYDLLSRFAYAKPVEKWPPLKRFDVLIDANVTMTWPTFAANRDEAEEQARKWMKLSGFEKSFRSDMKIIETTIGDVIEGGR